MSTTRRRGRIANWVQQGLGSLAVTGYRHPWRSSVVALAFTVVAGYYAQQLTVSADLSELLPESFPSVRALDTLKRRFGGIGFLVVAARGAEPDVLRRFAIEFSPKMESLPSIRYVDYQRPVAFFEDRALYFLDVEDLETMRDRLVEREAWERRKANPLFLDFEESDPPPVDFTDLQEKYAGRSDRQWVQAQLGEQFYIDPQKKLIALLGKPSSASLDLEYAKTLHREVSELVDTIDKEAYSKDLEIGLTGRYTKRIEQQRVIVKDLRVSSLVALLLVVGYLGIHFRRFLAVVLISIPLLLGLVWSFGFAGLIFGGLNILSAFISVILIGLGIDHGIHLLSRYQAEVAEGRSEEDAIRDTFGDTGRAIVVAGLTTTVGFAGLGVSEFRAFREFGVIAAGGTVLLVLAYVVILPSLLAFARHAGWQPRRPEDDSQGSFTRFFLRWPGRLLLLNTIIVVAVLALIPTVRFDYDFRALENSDLPSFRLDMETNELLGYSQTPIVILTTGEQEERSIATELRAQQLELGQASGIDFIAASADLVPEDQEKKQPIIARIGEIVRKVKPKWVAPEVRSYLKAARRMTRAEPFDYDTLPNEVLRQFRGVDSLAEEGFILIFPSVSLTDGVAISRLAAEVRGVKALEGKSEVVAGEAMILADILDMVTREAAPVLIFTLVLIFLTSWLLLGRLQDALGCLAPALVSLGMMLGLLSQVQLNLNYLNIVMIPVLFGIGVDGGAHIVTRLAGGQTLAKVMSETGRAIAGAILTTALGFGAMMLADHPGLDSLGKLAVLGLACNLLACLFFLPSFLAWWERRRSSTLGV